MVTFAYLKQLEQELQQCVREMEIAMQRAQKAGLLCELETVEIRLLGEAETFTQFRLSVRAPMNLLNSLES